MVGAISSLCKTLNPAQLTGPIFSKELRVSSRRRRNYALRFIYLAFLTGFVVVSWLAAMQISAQAGTALQVARMSLVGMTVITAVIWFQFIATQLIAIIMLSTSISDEIHHQTLGILMTTPINSLQIVMGKLLSKLFQLILLLTISLPLLAIVRVFGGVPWSYVISGLCITLTAAVFAGSLSLYFSTSSRRAYVVILKTAFSLAILYAFIPAILLAILQGHPLQIRFLSYLALLNPFGVMQVETMSMFSPLAAQPISFFPWHWHCLAVLVATALVLGRCVQVIRRVALRVAAGQLSWDSKRRQRRRQKNSTKADRHPDKSKGVITRVDRPPVVWKEFRGPLIEGPGSRNSIIGLIITLTALLITYAVCAHENCLDKDGTHTSYVLLFLLLALVVNLVLSAASITSEKETRSWAILLATPIDDWHILLGKVLGVFRRCLPIWLLLAGHVLFFVLAGYINPVAVFHLTLLVAWTAVFICGCGLYFSARLRRTTAAVVANIAVALVLWAVVPLLLGLVSQVSRDDDILEAYVSANPLVQAVVVTFGAAGEYNAHAPLSSLRYKWPGYTASMGRTTGVLLTSVCIYVLAGLFLAWRAKRRFRRNIF